MRGHKRNFSLRMIKEGTPNKANPRYRIAAELQAQGAGAERIEPRITYRKPRGKMWIKKTVKMQPPSPADYGRYGRTKRRGFWTTKPCAACGTPFDLRQHPCKKPNWRMTCSVQCAIRWRHHKLQEHAARMQYWKTPERKAYVKKWQQEHPENMRRSRQKFAEKNPERAKERRLEYYRRNRDVELAKMRAWQAANAEKFRASQNAYRFRCQQKRYAGDLLAAELVEANP